MCGRFVLNANGQAVQQQFDLLTTPKIEARYNIAPTQPLSVISNENPSEVTYYRWGLVPKWAKDLSMASKMINARSETVEEKPSFKHAFKRRRCLIPTTGFYEWTKRDNQKVPMYIHLKAHPVFAFAGIWEIWNSPQGDEVRTCTILTTDANPLLKDLHHRMPVILPKDDYDMWLSSDELPSTALKPLLQAYPAEDMDYYQVSTQVNRVANDVPELIDRYNPPRQAMLF